MGLQYAVEDETLAYLHEVLLDVQTELGEDEVAELITPALDDKIADAIQALEQYID